LNKTLFQNLQNDLITQNNICNLSILKSNQINDNFNNSIIESSNNDMLEHHFINRKRGSNGNIEGINISHHHNIFGVQNNAILINAGKEREERQMKIKAKKIEKKKRELNAIETKKSFAKESLDMAFGFPTNNNVNNNANSKSNLDLDEKQDFLNKKSNNLESDSSDLSSEEF